MINTTPKSAGSPTSVSPSRGLDSSWQNNSSGLFRSTKIFETMPTKDQMIEKLFERPNIIGSAQEDDIWKDYFRVLTDRIGKRTSEVNNQQSAKLLGEINNGIEIAFSVINHVYGHSKEHPRALEGLYYVGMIHHLGQRLQTEQRVQWLAELIAKWPQIIIDNLKHIVGYYDSAYFKCKGDSCTESLSLENTLQGAQSLFVGDVAAVHVVPIAKTLLTIIYLSESRSLKKKLGAELKKVIHDDLACNAIKQSVREYRQSLLPSPTPSRFINSFSRFRHQPVASGGVDQPVIQEQTAIEERSQFTADHISSYYDQIKPPLTYIWPSSSMIDLNNIPLAVLRQRSKTDNTLIQNTQQIIKKLCNIQEPIDEYILHAECKILKGFYDDVENAIKARDIYIVKDVMMRALKVMNKLERYFNFPGSHFKYYSNYFSVIGISARCLDLVEEKYRFVLLKELYDRGNYGTLLFRMNFCKADEYILGSLHNGVFPFTSKAERDEYIKKAAKVLLTIIYLESSESRIDKFADLLVNHAGDGVTKDGVGIEIKALLKRHELMTKERSPIMKLGGMETTTQPDTASSVQKYSSTESSAIKMNRQSQTVGGTAGVSVSQPDTVQEYSSTEPSAEKMLDEL